MYVGKCVIENLLVISLLLFHQVAKKVIVGLGCGVAVLRGANVFAQGVMGAPKSK